MSEKFEYNFEVGDRVVFKADTPQLTMLDIISQGGYAAYNGKTGVVVELEPDEFPADMAMHVVKFPDGRTIPAWEYEIRKVES